MHLAIDGYTPTSSALEDPEFVYRFLDQFPDTIGMTKIIAPQVVTYKGSVPEDWGVSGFVIIAESHISVHTWPARFFVNVDIFSCKEFDHETASSRVKSLFDLQSCNSWTLERGIEHYNPEEARKVLDSERDRLTTKAQG